MTMKYAVSAIPMSKTPTTFACGVDIVGPSSLVSLIESFPEYWKPFLEGTWYRRVGNPANADERKDLLARSPITKVGDIQRPLLIAQGAHLTQDVPRILDAIRANYPNTPIALEPALGEVPELIDAITGWILQRAE